MAGAIAAPAWHQAQRLGQSSPGLTGQNPQTKPFTALALGLWCTPRAI